MRTIPEAPETLAPTSAAYTTMQEAFDFFNRRLFDSTLPQCLITLQRHRGSAGYFCGGRFNIAGSQNLESLTDEIAMNPEHFSRGSEEVISTLVHEMVHLWQHHHGRAPKKVYHDKQWARKMREIGLCPSDTGSPGGKETGRKMSHYVIPGGEYARAFEDLQATRPIYLYQDLGMGGGKEKKKDNSKLKHSCPECGQNCWGKKGLRVECAECCQPMVAEDGEEDGGED